MAKGRVLVYPEKPTRRPGRQPPAPSFEDEREILDDLLTLTLRANDGGHVKLAGGLASVSLLAALGDLDTVLHLMMSVSRRAERRLMEQIEREGR